jgi:hypothetical protein
MKNLKTFEELNPSTYRDLRDRTADYPYSQYKAQSPEMKERADKMGRINQLSKERFESEFLSKFPKGTSIKVYDSESPNNIVELLFNEIQWRANWTYYNLDFKQVDSPFYSGSYNVHIRFHGDSEIPYTMDKGERVGFKGEILLKKESEDLVKSMFNFGKDVIEPSVEETPQVEEKPKGFITKVKDFFSK